MKVSQNSTVPYDQYHPLLLSLSDKQSKIFPYLRDTMISVTDLFTRY